MVVIKRFWRRTAMSSSTVQFTGACGDWVPIGQDLSSTSFGTDKTPGPAGYVVAISRAAERLRHTLGRTSRGRVFVASNADNAIGRSRYLLPDRHLLTAGAVRERHRRRSRESEPCLRLVLGLQRVCDSRRHRDRPHIRSYVQSNNACGDMVR